MSDSRRGLADLLISLQELANTVAGLQLMALAKFAAEDRDEVDPVGEFTHLEVAAILRVSQRYARTRLDLAEALTTRLPATLDALRAGRIDEYKARRVAEVTAALTPEHTAQVEAEVIPHAAEWNPPQLNARLRRTITRIDPEGVAHRAQARQAARHVRHEALDEGAGLLRIYGDGERTHLAHQRIQAIACQLKTTGDARSVDQIAADVALDCLAGKDFEHANIHVWLTIPATTALGVDEKPGYLAGYGWLPAQRALEMAAREDATWQRVLTDSATGEARDVGRRKYRPPAALTDHLRVRFPTCVGPGCRRPAHKCDLDHLVPFPTGPTDSENVRPLCRRHHRAKTHGGWRVDTTDTRPDKLGLVWVTKNGFRVPYEPEPIGDPDHPSTLAG